MRSFMLVTAPNCHLCAHGRDLLDALAVEGLLSWREVNANSEEGQALAATAPPLRPALFDTDRHVVAHGRLSVRRLRRQLEDASTPSLPGCS